MINGFFRYLVLISLALVAFAVPAQDEPVISWHNLSWSSPEASRISGLSSQALLYFDGAMNHDSLGLLPVFYDRIPLNGNESVVKVELINQVWQPLEIEKMSAYADLHYTGTEARIFTSVETERKKRFMGIYILPLRMVQTGLFEKLVSFEMRITKETGEPGRELEAEGRSYASNSVLSNGKWYRVSLKVDGIYRITYQDLKDLGLDPDSVDPADIRIYGNGSGMLDESNAVSRPDDLEENSIYVEGEEDGRFDPGDFILFYGQGPVKWTYNPFYQKFEHEVNRYTDETFYFLTADLGPGKRIQIATPPAGDPSLILSSYNDYAYHEVDDHNLIKSGQVWYGEVFSEQVEYDFHFDFPDIDPDAPVSVKTSVAARSTEDSDFSFFINDQLVVHEEIAAIIQGSSIYARSSTSNYTDFFTASGKLDVRVVYSKPEVTSIGWLNYFAFNAVSRLRFQNGQLAFRNYLSIGEGNVTEYRITTAESDVVIWDVTDHTTISRMQPGFDSGTLSFKDESATLKEYIIFDGTEYLSPQLMGEVPNQNLHAAESADYIIVVHPFFESQAEILADFHRQQSGLSVLVVTPQEIYNEFSSGVQDVSAIRDFVRMLYDRAEEGKEPRYLLLFGDASYDYKNRTQEDNNMVPTFESRESLRLASSYATDDFFGCMDADEGSNGSGTPDIGVGRFPVHTVEQADQMLEKIFHYAGTDNVVHNKWRNLIAFVADDGDNNIHLNQAEELCNIVDTLAPCFNIRKIYLDAYQQLKTPSGDRYPDVNSAIDKAVRDGSMIINYTGHGGEVGWADERVLDIPTINGWTNMDNLPIFVTATCEFSRYDDPGLVSAGELVILNSRGGGISLFTTSRLAYSQSNFSLNKKFYEAAFVYDTITGEYPRMGDLVRKAKTPANQNIKNFVLLGDPALTPAYPKFRISTDTILSETAGGVTDTLKALARITVIGRVHDLAGNLLTSFNGRLYPTVYDKAAKYKTKANDNSSREQNFFIQDKVIYHGESTIHNGRFSFSFVVPRDIVYSFGPGKISYYGVDTITSLDAQGHYHAIIGGVDESADNDQDGPEIEVFLNHLDFKSGDFTTPEPMMIATFHDESGINTVGNGIGHDLTAIVDTLFSNPVILNDHFVPETDDFTRGTARYRLGPFINGTYSLTVKAWDVFNNSSEETIIFIVNTGKPILLSQVINYPNPFREGTYFSFRHNKPGETCYVTINIFNGEGRFVRSLQDHFNTEYLKSEPLYWDGTDAGGSPVGAGLYIFQVLVNTSGGASVQQTQKMIIIR